MIRYRRVRCERTGIGSLIDALNQRIAAAVGIPQTILLGSAPSDGVPGPRTLADLRRGERAR